MRVLMTRCVGQAWATFCQERREVVVKSFRQLGISLPINGSSDGELSIKGLSTARLMTAMMDWKTRGVPTGDAEDSEDSESESEVEDDEDDDGPLELMGLPPALESSILPEHGRGFGRRGRPRGSRTECGGRKSVPTGASEEPETSSITNYNSLSSAPFSERGRASGRRGGPRGSRTERGRRRKSASTGSSEEPETSSITNNDLPGSAPSPERGRGSGRRGRPHGSRTELSRRKSASTGPSAEPKTSSITNNDLPGSAPSPERGRASGRRGRPRGSRTERGGRRKSTSTGPSAEPRRSQTTTHLALRHLQSEVAAVDEEVDHVDRAQNVVEGNLLQPGLLKSRKPRQSQATTRLAQHCHAHSRWTALLVSSLPPKRFV
ncbi:hypothetical protein FN846DRAFT_949762 [Sphaerosporella brunnea]|uniref:Uncharacterized protein n=1 Tax=Sphaerosporella brunnea TaxID=1250544 RepID=A0A5J5EWY2_9PEZI|nr:hypothetical protein FN846DRAFT_949762 [Sphaerosporella brunnea]